MLMHYNYSGRRYVMLKIFIQASSMGQLVDNELKMYRRMEQSPKGHPGRDAVRTLLDTFYIDGPEDKHRCLVHPPLWESVLTFLRRNPVERLPSAVVAYVLRRLFWHWIIYIRSARSYILVCFVPICPQLLL